jgi:hypothetical protein
MHKTKTEILISALDVLSLEIQSGDGVANATVAEAATRLRELNSELETARKVIADDVKLIKQLKANAV